MFKSLCCVAVLLSASALPMVAQNMGGMRPGTIDMSADNPSLSPAATSVDPARAQWDAKALQTENQNRQIALKKDTDKLLELATELKQNVDRTGPNILSLDVVKKAQEIEKLAKSVKDKMKGD